MVRWLLWGAALASVGAVPVMAQTAPVVSAGLQPNETLLEVDATGEAKGVPDRASLSAEIETDGATPAEALAANSRRSAALADAARAVGVPDKAMQTTDLSVSRKFKLDKDGNETDQVIGYTASSRFTLHELTVPVASKAINALARAGLTGLSGPSFGFSNAQTLRRKSRADAVAQAKAQAEDYAAALGMRVSRVLRVSERRSQGGTGSDIVVTGMRRKMPPPVLLPGEQTITTQIWIDFALTPK